jgi:hypothetical protein
MSYNKNFNKCEMAEYLITNGKNYVIHGTMIVMKEFISKFKYPDFNTVLDVDRLITSNKRFDVTINGVTYNDVLPYYAMFIEHRGGFPGDGFFDAFMTQNREVYNQVASSTPSNNLTSQQMQNIVDIAKNALNQHINLNFPTSDHIDMFINTEMVNKGKCHKENLF